LTEKVFLLFRKKYQLHAGIPVEVVYFGYLKTTSWLSLRHTFISIVQAKAISLVDANSETDIGILHKKYHC